MKNTMILILLALVLCSNVILAVFFFNQKKEIDNIKGGNGAVVTPVSEDLQIKNLPEDQAAEINSRIKAEEFQALIDGERQIMGDVMNVTENSILVKAKVQQLDDLKNADLRQPSSVTLKDVELTVLIDGNTLFEGRDKSALKQGDRIIAEDDKSIYRKESFTAKKIKYLDPIEDPIKATEEKQKI